MKIIDRPTPLRELVIMAQAGFGDLVKAVVDVEQGIMAVDGEFHSDEEALLLAQGSEQRYLPFGMAVALRKESSNGA